MPFIRREFRSLYLAMVACFALFGAMVTVLGATLPKIIHDFGWSYVAAGLVLSAGPVGYFVSAFCSGMAMERRGPKRVIVTSLILQAAGLSLFAQTPSVAANLLLALLIGLGQGGMEVVVNYSVVRMERDGRSRLMNLMHAAFAIGAITSPLVAAQILARQGRWQTMYPVIACGALVMAGALSLLPFERLRGGTERIGDKSKTLELLRHPLLVLSFFVLLFFVGSELGVSSWVAEYSVTVLGARPETGALIVSVFWAGLLVGRVGLSLAYHGVHQAELLFGLAAMSTVSLFLAILVRSPWAAAAGFFLTGLGYSAIYPLVMALAGKYFQRGQGVAVGFLSAGGGVGEFLFPFLMAAISQRFGLWNGFLFYGTANVATVVLTLLIVRRARVLRRMRSAAAEHDPPLETS